MFGLLRLFFGRDRWRAYTPFLSILLFTLIYPATGLPVAWFDDFALRWFPQGTPPGFVGVELGGALLFWLLCAGLIALGKELNGRPNWCLFRRALHRDGAGNVRCMGGHYSAIKSLRIGEEERVEAAARQRAARESIVSMSGGRRAASISRRGTSWLEAAEGTRLILDSSWHHHPRES